MIYYFSISVGIRISRPHLYDYMSGKNLFEPRRRRLKMRNQDDDVLTA